MSQLPFFDAVKNHPIKILVKLFQKVLSLFELKDNLNGSSLAVVIMVCIARLALVDCVGGDIHGENVWSGWASRMGIWSGGDGAGTFCC